MKRQRNSPGLFQRTSLFMRHSVRIQIGVLFLFTGIACLLLYPLPRYLTTGLLEARSGDPLLQVWVVQWNIHKLTSSLAQYFDANIFYPYFNTFAYHDHMFLLGVLGLPISLFSQNPILTYNVLLMGSFIFAAYAMFLLCRDLTRNSSAALIGGIIFGFLPYRFAHLDHLNLLSIQWFPLCLLFLTRALFPDDRSESKGLSSVFMFWGFFLLQVLTSFNYLFMLTFIVAIYGATILAAQWWFQRKIPLFASRKMIGVFLLGACLVGICLLPLALPYLHANQDLGFQRTAVEIEALSARVRDYLVAPKENFLYGRLTQRLAHPNSPFPREQVLFGGTIPVMLAAIGVIGAWTRRARNRASQRHLLCRVYVVLLVVAGVVSLGPSAAFLGRTISLPYLWLYKFVPGFKSMRVPARFGLIVWFALAVLAALGVSYLTDRLIHRGKRAPLAQMAITALVGGLILLEYFSPVKPLTFYPATVETIPPVYRWLAQQPRDVRILELPVDSAKANFEYTYYSTFHWKQILNGRSAFIPEGTLRLFGELRTFPSPRSIALLQSLGVSYVVLHTEHLDPGLSERLPASLRLIEKFDHDLVVELVEKPQEIWQRSGRFVSPAFSLDTHFPSELGADADYILGLTFSSAPSSTYCPLPYERMPLEISWSNSSEETTQKMRHLPLPLLIHAEDPPIVPVRITTPPRAARYRVSVTSTSPLVVQQSREAAVNIVPTLLDSRNPGRLDALVLRAEMPEDWEMGTPLPLRMQVKNTGDTLWKALVADRRRPVGEVHLAVVNWHATGAGQPERQPARRLLVARGFLPYDVAPGEEVWVSMSIPTPDQVGEYTVSFDMVSELLQWFSADGSPMFTQTIVLHKRKQ